MVIRTVSFWDSACASFTYIYISGTSEFLPIELSSVPGGKQEYRTLHIRKKNRFADRISAYSGADERVYAYNAILFPGRAAAQ